MDSRKAFSQSVEYYSFFLPKNAIWHVDCFSLRSVTLPVLVAPEAPPITDVLLDSVVFFIFGPPVFRLVSITLRIYTMSAFRIFGTSA